MFAIRTNCTFLKKNCKTYTVKMGKFTSRTIIPDLIAKKFRIRPDPGSTTLLLLLITLFIVTSDSSCGQPAPTNCYLSTCLTMAAPGRVEDDQHVFFLLEQRLERLLREVNNSRLSGAKGS